MKDEVPAAMLDMHLRAATQSGPAAALAASGIAGTDPGDYIILDYNKLFF